MDVDFIIAGQGIAGTWLSYVLWKSGYKIMVADHTDGKNSSLAAGALINPVNVNRAVAVKDAASIMTMARQQYREMEQVLQCSFYKENTLFVWNDFKIEDAALHHPFIKMLSEKEQSRLSVYITDGPAAFKVEPVGCIDASVLLQNWKAFLRQQQAFVAAKIHAEQIREKPGGLQWNGISAKGIIFCNGAAAMRQPLFQHIPFTPNCGDALLLDIPEGHFDRILHLRHLRLIPLGANRYWCGSNYRWDYKDVKPDAVWREQTEAFLRKWLRVPFAVREHIVAERPTTAGQQPVYGFLKKYPRIGIFNGLGTRGFSLAPVLARQFVSAIQKGQIPEV